MLGILLWIIEGVKQYLMTSIQQRFTVRIKAAVFKKMIYLQPSWHENEKVKLANYSNLLINDIDKIKNLNSILTC